MPDGQRSREMNIESMGRKFFGKYRGVVADNVDPVGRGRLRVKVPAVMGDQAIWALPCVPYAGKGVGFFAMPGKDTPVWVEFEAGDPSYPIWAGCFWAEGDLLPTQAIPTNKFFITEKTKYEVDDLLGAVSIRNQAGGRIEIDPLKIRIQSSRVWCLAGKNTTNLTPLAFDVNNGAFTVV